MANADRERESGNDHFRLKAYRKAVRCYNKGLATFNGLHFLTEEEQAHLNTSLLPLHANLAAALYHLKDYPKAIENACKALAIDPQHEKALYRLGLAHEALHDHDQAQDVYRRLAGMRPESALYRQALVRIQGVEREALKHSIFVDIFNKPHGPHH
ncbi:tetratricopeptide repeat domain containing protein [Acanthamoeba castellanii str. Neff]|uniref:Tetratricopeptide repeat domain containing protein n=1 Tax=Acanthamoeba castellanii (strain ATCC 30010 / Neff) TaxID=1257118 RepID=L8GSW6_ACACF|nr:tetratricopeptide repeat domain containing protein [Acanthamoeba castellanii str. Neff]ELR16294.1 tetratricopeptide repeat domain containing protein [Acanthamoeba castellanii str. Neff]